MNNSKLPESILQANTILDILNYRTIHQPQQTAYNFLVDGETEVESLTYEQLAKEARVIAFTLQSNCTTGDRALLLYPSSLDYIVAFFGCLYAGVIAVPVYPPRLNRSFDRISHIIADAQPKVALTLESILNTLKGKFSQTPELESLSWITTNKKSENLTIERKLPRLDNNNIAFLQYTSGSTASPKGVTIDHSNLIENLEAIYQYFEHGLHSHVISWLPLYHDMGLIGTILQPLYGGFCSTLMSPLMFLQRPLRWLEAISRYKGTSSGAPNFAYDFCVQKIKPKQITHLDLSSWDVAFNGAEPINHQTLEQFADLFRPYGFHRQAFYTCYGIAEATLMVSGGKKAAPVVTKKVETAALEQNKVAIGNDNENDCKIIVSCGQTIPNHKIKIVNPETLTQCSEREIGEVWVSGASVARGYWHQSELSKQTFASYLADTKEGPFLRTGDLGFLNEEELFITGRLKDLIIINGSNYYPQDLEWIMEQSNTQIRSGYTAAFSVEMEGKEQLVVMAEIERSYWKNRLQANDHIEKKYDSDESELIRAIKRAIFHNYNLEVYAVRLLQPGTIPKTSSGKIQRQACKYGFLKGNL